MNRSTFRTLFATAISASFAVVSMTTSAAPTTVQAQALSGPSPAAVSAPLLSPEQVRAEFVDQGFQASQPILWTIDSTTSFTVEDPADHNSPSGRVLMVIVYPDLTSAQAAHRADGRLVPGYGPSIFQGNVALMQTTHAELVRRYAAEVNRDDPSYVGTDVQPETMAQPSDVVGLDFLAVVQPAETANL